jgi:hypothetical protein
MTISVSCRSTGGAEPSKPGRVFALTISRASTSPEVRPRYPPRIAGFQRRNGGSESLARACRKCPRRAPGRLLRRRRDRQAIRTRRSEYESRWEMSGRQWAHGLSTARRRARTRPGWRTALRSIAGTSSNDKSGRPLASLRRSTVPRRKDIRPEAWPELTSGRSDAGSGVRIRPRSR